MSSNLVIAAIPDENDRVWKVSSEKIPHLTVLFLGETDKVANLEQIMLFVEHAANTTLQRFYLPVDRRGELGDDKADVLFFKKGRYDYKAIRDFRATLLKDANIKTAYDSASQFDGPWNPHLTLGYPSAPAKSLDDNESFSFFDVQFNKIAVWTGDFEGPDWLLKDYWDEMETLDAVPMDVAMSDIHHFGTKGMRWGQSKTDRQFSKSETLRAKADELKGQVDDSRGVQKKFLQNRESSKRRVAGELRHEVIMTMMNKTTKAAKRDLDELHKKPEFQNINGQDEKGNRTFDVKKFKALEKAEADIWSSHLNKTAEGQNAFDVKISGGTWNIAPKKIKHADTTEVVRVRPIRDENSYLIDVELVDTQKDSVKQTVDLVEEILSHHGVKGQKWGVRKLEAAGAARSVGRAATSAGGTVGKVAKATARFAGDVSFENRVESGKAREMVVNAASKPYRKQDLPAVKARHGDYGKLTNRAKKPFSQEARAYRKDARETYIKRLESTANSMTNVSGDRQYTIRERGNELPAEGGALPTSKTYWDVSSRRVKHAPEDDFTRLEVIFDEEGWITDLKPVEVETSMAQTIDLGKEFISHYGIKGMHWGVRRQGELTTKTHIDAGVFRRRTKVKAEGGESHPASEDAINAAVQKQKLKKSGTAALSNKELRDLQTRLQLEAQVELLATRKGKKFVSKQIEEQGKQQLQKGVGVGVRKATPHVIKKARKGAATAAVAALL